MPFEFDDDDVDDDVPILSLGDEDEEDQRNIPTFRLGGDEVDDDVAFPSSISPTPAGPVFDLSSELEDQLPPPLARPTYNVSDGEVTPPSTPAPPAEPTAPAGPTAFSLDASATVPVPPATPLDEAFHTTADMPSALPQPSSLFNEEGPDEYAGMPQEAVFQRRIFEAMLPTLLELVSEIRRSLEYYSSREPETPVQRVIIYGGTSRLPNLAVFFNHEIGMEVQVADPIQALDLSSFRQPQDYLQDLAPALPVCIGLGLRDMIE